MLAFMTSAVLFLLLFQNKNKKMKEPPKVLLLLLSHLLLLLLLLLLVVFTVDSECSTVIPVVDPGYKNVPIAASNWNYELSTDGKPFSSTSGVIARPSSLGERALSSLPPWLVPPYAVTDVAGGSFLQGIGELGAGTEAGTRMIAKGRGWCKTNSGCPSLLGPNVNVNDTEISPLPTGNASSPSEVYETCFSQFYVKATAPGVFVKRTSPLDNGEHPWFQWMVGRGGGGGGGGGGHAVLSGVAALTPILNHFEGDSVCKLKRNAGCGCNPNYYKCTSWPPATSLAVAAEVAAF